MTSGTIIVLQAMVLFMALSALATVTRALATAFAALASTAITLVMIMVLFVILLAGTVTSCQPLMPPSEGIQVTQRVPAVG